MRTLIFTTAATMAITALASAGAASAAPTGGANAGDTIKTLQGEGFNVQINGTASVPLSRCTVTDVHGLPNAADPGQRGSANQLNTVYVDISCPDDV